MELTAKNISEVILKYLDSECGYTPPENQEFESLSIEMDAGLDSLDRVELVMYLEDELDVKLDDETVDSWNTFGDVIRSIAD
jgi:acyl carrier protein